LKEAVADASIQATPQEVAELLALTLESIQQREDQISNAKITG
jgi:hypothetical protein